MDIELNSKNVYDALGIRSFDLSFAGVWISTMWEKTSLKNLFLYLIPILMCH